jgi:GNAT superfamily N-acetyltransferase
LQRILEGESDKSGRGRRVAGSLSFRWAQAGDFQAVFSLASQLATQIEADIPPLTPERFRKFYVGDAAPMRLLLAVRDGQVLGMISWTLTHELYSADARVYISDISVSESVRGEGVGAALMSRVKAWAIANGARKLGWEVWYRNFSAKAFYDKLGGQIDQEAIPYVLALEA